MADEESRKSENAIKETALHKAVDKEKRELLSKGEISIILDTYDDIFSDFDPRPYSKRSLSDDFLREAKKASLAKGFGDFELALLMPKGLRKPDEEAVIKKRLRDYFRKHASLLEEEKKKTMLKAVGLGILGFSLLTGATVISYSGNESLAAAMLLILLEPSGWFCLWFAFDTLFFYGKDKNADLEFYRRMSRCEIEFCPY